MADETSETVDGGGTSGDFDARAAFISGMLGDGAGESDDAPKGGDKDEPADDDSDLDEDQERDEVEDDRDGGDESDGEDEDSDLDEEDDEDKADKDVDTETAKRLAQVRRTDQRLREQREKHFAAREAELDARATQLEEQLKPHREKLEKFEKAVARAAIDPAGVLLALGVPEDRYEHVAQVIYTLAKGKDDPKARAAAAQLMKERERDAEIEDLKKWREDREKTDAERAKTAAADRELDAYFGKVAKATSEKTPLAAAFLKADPTEARGMMEVIAFRLAKETGSLPKERDVIIALEKDRRGLLRKLGIDPKSVSAKKATAAIEASQTKTAPKKGDKKPAKPTAKVDDDLPLTKEAFIKGNLH